MDGNLSIFKSLSHPLYAELEIIPYCPNNCVFCESTKRNIYTNLEHKSLLSTRQIFSIIDKLAEWGIKRIFFTGGEPTLRKDLIELIKYTREYNIECAISSNGYGVTEHFTKELRRMEIHTMQLSIEGPNREIHETVTRRRGSFDWIIRALKNLQKEGIQIDVTTVLTKYNEDYIKLMPLFLDKYKIIKGYRVLRYMTFYKQDFEHITLPTSYFTKIYPLTQDNAFNNNFTFLVSYFPGIYIATKPKIMSAIPSVCYAGKTKIGILPDGSVIPCNHLRENRFIVGNILDKDTTLEDIWYSSIMTEFRNMTPNDYRGYCSKCPNKWICYSCRAIAYRFDKKHGLYGDDVSCILLNKRLREDMKRFLYSSQAENVIKDINRFRKFFISTLEILGIE